MVDSASYSFTVDAHSQRQPIPPGHYSAATILVRINAQWRICFRWADEGPYEVEIVDYH